MRSCSASVSRTSAGVAIERVERRAQPRERRAQLVAGVGGEAPGRLQRPRGRLGGGVQAGEHLVEGARERADLVGPLVLGERRGEVLGAADARRAVAQARERAHGDAGQQPGERPRQHQGQHAQPEDLAADPGHAVLDGGEGREDLHPDAPALARRHGERAPVAARDRHGAQAVLAGQRGRVGGHVAPPADDLAVDRELHEGPRPRQQALVGRAAGPSSPAEALRAQDLAREARGARGEVGVDRRAAVALDRGQQRRARHQAAQREREHRRHREPGAQAARQPWPARAQTWRTHPTPRTVRMMRRSPTASSLRRR